MFTRFAHLGHRSPVLLEELDATHVDFKARSMTMSPFMEFVFAILETAALANFVLQGADDLPLDRFRRTFDTVGRTWSLRVAYRLRLAMKVEGAEHLENVKTKPSWHLITSIIDFCLAFCDGSTQDRRWSLSHPALLPQKTTLKIIPFFIRFWE